MSKLKIIIATGIFPPALGGPATFAQNLYEGFKSKGHDVRVVTFGSQGGKNENQQDGVIYVRPAKFSFLRYLKFFLAVWKLAGEAQIIYAFDLVSAGFPCTVVKTIKPKIKLAFRLGGDFQWEAALQKRYFDDTLRRYWEEKNFGFYEKIVFWLSKFSLKKADIVVFNANLMRDIYVKYRGMIEQKTTVIKNFVPKAISMPPLSEPRQDNIIKIIFIGRLIAMKNLIRLLKAFEELIRGEPLKKKWRMELAGEGPEEGRIKEYVAENSLGDYVAIRPKMSRAEVLEKIENSDIVANVSLTEVNAHFAAEALSLRKPIILTKESEQFYTKQKNELIYYVDPLDIDDIAGKISEAVKKIGTGVSFNRTQIQDFAWPTERVIREHETLFSRLIAIGNE